MEIKLNTVEVLILATLTITIVLIVYRYRRQEAPQVSYFHVSNGKAQIPHLGIELKHFPNLLANPHREA